MDEIRGVAPHIISAIYDDNESLEKAHRILAVVESANYKKEVLDPNRQVVKWERELAQNKRKKRKQVII